jgi:porin
MQAMGPETGRCQVRGIADRRRCLFLGAALATCRFASAASSTGPPAATEPAVVEPRSAASQAYDSTGYALNDFFGLRQRLDHDGVCIVPQLIFDDSQDFHGGLREGNSPRMRFDLPIAIDTQKLFGLAGGTLFASYQLEQGGNASRSLVGDAQEFTNSTNSNNRSQLGQLWYEQKLLNGQLRVRVGKEDGNTDFDVLDNGADFLNNSFSTAPTLQLLPSYPENAMAIQAFYEPDGRGPLLGPASLEQGGFYLGGGVFDGSAARGVHTGGYGPAHFLDSENDLFLIAEAGVRYRIRGFGTHLPGKLSVGGWWDTNSFPRLSGNDEKGGNDGVYVTWDQVLYKPPHRAPTPSGQRANNAAEEEQEEFPGALASTFSVSYADPSVNVIDGNAMLGLTYTGPLTRRDKDVLGLGGTAAQFADGARTRNPCELAIEAFYRIRFTHWLSLTPDLQYIVHPSGAGAAPAPLLHDALVGTLRLEMTF